LAWLATVLRDTGELQSWHRTLELQHHLASLFNRTSATERASLLEQLTHPTQGAGSTSSSGSCTVTPAVRCSQKSPLRNEYLIVMTTFVSALPLVRIQYELYMKEHQHLIVSDHWLSGTSDDLLVGLRWGTSMAMKTLAGITCAHTRRVAAYDFMLVLDDDTAVDVASLDAILVATGVQANVPRLLTPGGASHRRAAASSPDIAQQRPMSDSTNHSDGSAQEHEARWGRKEARLRSKGKDVTAYEQSYAPVRHEPCPMLSSRLPCVITGGHALSEVDSRGDGGRAWLASQPLHRPDGPWPVRLWMNAGFPAGGVGMLLSHAGAAHLDPFVPTCLQCLTCPFYGASNVARAGEVTQRGAWSSSGSTKDIEKSPAAPASIAGAGAADHHLSAVPDAVRTARDAADRLLGFGECAVDGEGAAAAADDEERGRRNPRCAGTDVQLGACWARSGLLTQELTQNVLDTASTERVDGAVVPSTWSRHLSNEKRNHTLFAEAVARLTGRAGAAAGNLECPRSGRG